MEYDCCVVSYTDPKTGRVIKGTANSESYQEKLDKAAEAAKSKKKSSSKTTEEEVEKLVITDRKVSSIAEATALAEKLLKLANKFEREVTLTTKGSPMLCAGLSVYLYGFGYWSGKYIISKAKHDVSAGSGYTTQLTLRRADEVALLTAASGKPSYKVGDTVNFTSNYQYKTSTAAKANGSKRKAGKALIVAIADLGDAHPYKLQGGKYNKLKGKCNVNGWVNLGTFTSA